MQLALLHGASCVCQQGNGDKGQSVCGGNQHSQHSPVLAALGAVQSPSPAAWDQQGVTEGVRSMAHPRAAAAPPGIGEARLPRGPPALLVGIEQGPRDHTGGWSARGTRVCCAIAVQ